MQNINSLQQSIYSEKFPDSVKQILYEFGSYIYDILNSDEIKANFDSLE
jgi:hypothetical protein